MARSGSANGYDFKIIEAVEKVNAEQKLILVDKVKGYFGEDLAGMKLGLWGLAFKPDTDDMRSAPAVDIINVLQHEGAKIKAYDPVAMPNAKTILKNITYCKDPYTVARDCDCLLVLTEWKEFKNLNFKKLRLVMKQPVIFDGRNMYHDKDLEDLGFEYYGVGRGQ